MKRVSIVIGGKRYTITLEEPFAEFVEKELEDIFDMSKNNDTKLLLQAFLSKQIECLELEQKIDELIKKLSV
jgi:phosphate uptake regulator